MDRREWAKANNSIFVLKNEQSMKGIIAIYMNSEEEGERYSQGKDGESILSPVPKTNDEAMNEALQDAWSNDKVLLEVPLKREVCSTCNGTGSHVNPSIDSNGITEDEFREDPDFAEAYFSGQYDVRCYECCGNNVSLVIDEDNANENTMQRIYDYWQDKAECAYEREAERRMGA